MICDNKRLSDGERLRLFASIHNEPDCAECEALIREVPKALQQRVDPLHELEKLQASELLMRARHIDSHLSAMDNMERAAFGRAARREAAMLLDAARKSDRYVPEEVPEYLMKAGAI